MKRLLHLSVVCLSLSISSFADPYFTYSASVSTQGGSAAISVAAFGSYGIEITSTGTSTGVLDLELTVSGWKQSPVRLQGISISAWQGSSAGLWNGPECYLTSDDPNWGYSGVQCGFSNVVFPIAQYPAANHIYLTLQDAVASWNTAPLPATFEQTVQIVAIPAPVPEPSTWALLAAGVGVAVWRRRR